MKMLKKYMILCLACTLMLTAILSNVVLADNNGSAINVGNGNGKVGDEISIALELQNVPEDLIGIKINIGYDNSKIKLLGAQDAKLLAEYVDPDLTKDNGTLILSWGNGLQKIPSNTSGTIATLTFKILDGFAEGTTSINATVEEAYDFNMNEISFTSKSGAVTLDQPVHQHTFGEWSVVTEAGCDSTGLRRRVCSGCGQKEEETIQALGHISEWQVVKEASCVEEGIKQQICTRCNTVLATEAIPKVDHVSGDWEIVKTASCLESGEQVKKCQNCQLEMEKETIAALGHQYGEWEVKKNPTISEEGEEQRVCSRCNDVESRVIPKIVHEDKDHHFDGKSELVKEATCTEPGEQRVYCSVDGCSVYQTVEIPAKGHTVSDWQITKEATCTEEGEQVKKCAVCNQVIEKQSIPVKEHTLGEWKTVKETSCLEEGEENQCCTICSQIINTRAISKLGHSLGEWTTKEEATCIKEGSKEAICTRCGETATEAIPMVEHTIGDWVIKKEATCTDEGLKEKVCSVCNSTISTEIISMLGHEYEEGIVIKEATCTENGCGKQVCKRCQEQKEYEIPALGHSYGEMKVVKEATFNEDGKGERECERCQSVLEIVLPKLSEDHTHDFSGEAIIVKEPTCTQKGLSETKCSNPDCTAIQTTELAMLQHSFGEWTTIKEATNQQEGMKERICKVCGEKEQQIIPATSEKMTQINKNNENGLKKTVVQTGDTTNRNIWMFIFTLSGAAIIGMLVLRKLKTK